MQERYARFVFSSAVILQLLAAIWWASALNSTVSAQHESMEKNSNSAEIISTKVALLELRVQNLEEISRETRDLVRKVEEKLK